MRNEDYNDIDPTTGYGRGLTTEQQWWQRNYRDGSEFFSGRRKRQLASLGFKLRPETKYDRHHKRIGVEYPQLTTAQRFVAPRKVDVVTMAWDYEDAYRVRSGKQVVYRALVQVGSSTSDGFPVLGGTPECVHREFDFARQPRQEVQLYLTVDQKAGALLYDGPPGKYQVRDNGLYTDLCVGTHGPDQTPTVIYRIHDRDVDALTVGTSGVRVESGATLAVLERGMRIDKASFDADGSPRYDSIGGMTMSADRNVPLFRMLLQMDQNMNEVALGYESDNPRLKVASIASWAPRIMLVINEEEANQLIENVDELPDSVEQAARQAVGPEGNFHLKCQRAGIFVSLLPSEGHPHLQMLTVKDPTTGEERAQPLPISAILLDHVKPGVLLRYHEDIADIVPRFVYPNAMSLQNELGPNHYWFFVQFIRQQVIWPGTANWQGPGALIDVRYMPHLVQPSSEWMFDFEPCYQSVGITEGCIVGPPFALLDPTDTERNVNGAVLQFGKVRRPQQGRMLRRAPAAPAARRPVEVQPERKRKTRNQRRRLKAQERKRAGHAPVVQQPRQLPPPLPVVQEVPQGPDPQAMRELLEPQTMVVGFGW